MIIFKYFKTHLADICKRKNIIHRHYKSALYISGDKATKTCAVLTPYIDIEENFKNLDDIIETIECRHLSIDIAELNNLWNLYNDMEKTRKKLDDYRMSITDKIKALKVNAEASSDEMVKLTNNGKIVREDLKLLKEHLQPIKENVITKILDLPNTLHDMTPRTNNRVEYTYLSKPREFQKDSHVFIGEKLNLLRYMNSNNHYLIGEASLMEQGVLNFFCDHLEKNDYIPFSNPDFSRSVIVEGCGISYNNFDKVFTLEDPDAHSDAISKLHLTGGASIFAFMAYHTKLTLYPSIFPLQYYSLGRQYTPSINSSYGLFDAAQSTCIHIFTATTDCEEKVEQEFLKLVSICVDAYKNLGYHFRVVYRPAYELQNCESLRASFEMYSSHLEKYVEVGYLSMYDTYLSKRLLFTYRVGKQYMFPKVISGSIINFGKLLGCVLEENSLGLTIPNICKLQRIK